MKELKEILKYLLILLILNSFFLLPSYAEPFLYFPLKGNHLLTCHFCGYQYKNGKCHGAIDIDVLDEGTKVYAAAEGEVIKVVDSPTSSCKKRPYGNHLIILHPNGYTTLYAHLKAGSLKVKVRDHVLAGQEIGEGDNTGCSSGSHLHFEVRDPQGKRVDPYDAPFNWHLCLSQEVKEDCGKLLFSPSFFFAILNLRRVFKIK